MTTKLDKPLKREVAIDGTAYTVTFTPDELRIVEKGRRSGRSFRWHDLVSDSVSLTRDLKQSLDRPDAAGAPATGPRLVEDDKSD